MADDKPTTTPAVKPAEVPEAPEPKRPYRTKEFRDLVSWTQYECAHPECDFDGNYSRFDTPDEAVMQEHQRQAHAGATPDARLQALGLVKP
jgi:hypothetical protein